MPWPAMWHLRCFPGRKHNLLRWKTSTDMLSFKLSRIQTTLFAWTEELKELNSPRNCSLRLNNQQYLMWSRVNMWWCLLVLYRTTAYESTWTVSLCTFHSAILIDLSVWWLKVWSLEEYFLRCQVLIIINQLIKEGLGFYNTEWENLQISSV